MKNLLFICLLFITSIGFSQTTNRDSVELSFTNDFLNMKYVTKINYWEYVTNKSYIYIPIDLNPSIRFGFNNKKLYICKYNYFYYRQDGRKWKFIY